MLRLKYFFSVFIFAVFFFSALSNSASLVAQGPTYATPEEAKLNVDFDVQGEYRGENRAIQVIAAGDGEFTIVIYEGGLPGDGWRGDAVRRIDGDADVVDSLIQSMGLKKILRESPTLGATPPAGAIHLFDGTQESIDKYWQPGARRTDDGLLIQGATTKELFTDYLLHVEFRTPFMPAATGQQRGNSGVYHQGRYENQVLDSFGLEGTKNETGSIYDIKKPDVNTCYPPLRWQTYDVIFTAAKYDDAGNKLTDAKLTTRLNGVVVQNDESIPQATRAAPLAEGNSPGPIYFQDHGNPVRFRNIWVLPRDSKREARRPIVPGVERFYSNIGTAPVEPQISNTSPAVAGEILLSNLGCVNCHSEQTSVWQSLVGPKLTEVASRVRKDYLIEWLQSPHEIKPGTTMPDVLGHLPNEEKVNAVKAIASYLLLASDGAGYADRVGDARSSERGESLYHSIGCVACHAARDGSPSPAATSVPLGNLSNKYTLSSLTQFLQNPHSVRPSGRMPKLTTDPAEARDIATFLLKDTVIVPGAQQFLRTVYRGSWDSLPDFSKETPNGEPTTVSGLTFDGILPLNNFGAVYEAYLPIQKEDTYQFTIGSDDGSRLLIDGQEIVRVDGIHPYQKSTGKVKLQQGVHKIRVEYFEQGGEERLSLEIEGGDFGRSEIDALVTQDASGKLDMELVQSSFVASPELVDIGRDLFKSTGCANCHEMVENGRKVEPTLVARELSKIRNPKTRNYLQGCLAEQPAAGLPNYDLSPDQQRALRIALSSVIPRDAEGNVPDDITIHANLVAANCYACHERDGIGGPESSRDSYFQTTTMEMGNEGRLPPPLTGVGDKLNEAFIAKYLEEGANERPYMKTRMPGFGYEGLKSLHNAMVRVDSIEDQRIKPESIQSPQRMKADGRTLVGNDGLACVKCHTFNGEGTPGIQAIDMLKMTDRLRKDWFHRYLCDPQKYRLGTRMPASFPDGVSVLKTIADGSPAYQIESMWMYLKDGKQAKIPNGLRPGAIELVPTDRPIIYRNFLTDLTPRGIAVGYPEGVNIAWDANRMALRKIWQNQFLDASLHWQGRGPGNLGPLGDLVQTVDESSVFAKLDSIDAEWPEKTDDSTGYRFRGYKLDESGRPIFKYSIGGCSVAESYKPESAEDGSKRLQRTLEITNPPGDLVARFASGDIQVKEDSWFLVNNNYYLRIDGIPVSLRSVDGKMELRGQVGGNQTVTIQEHIRW